MRVRCPHCGHCFRVERSALGQRGPCPQCRKMLRIPAISKAKIAPLELMPAADPANSTDLPASQSPAIRPSGVLNSISKRRIKISAIWGGAALTLCAVAFLGWDSLSIPHAATRMAAAADSPPSAAPAASFEQDLLPFIQKYCADCHGNGSSEGDFALDRYQDLASMHRDRAVWTKLLKLVELESMPPSSADQPTPEERAKAVAWIDHQLFYVDCSVEQNPGRVTVHRLNRTEYNNTVNALLGINFQPADQFPSDDVGYGFDNIADVLTVPPLLVEKYLAAAESIAAVAIRNLSPLYFEEPMDRHWELKGGVQRTREGHIFSSLGTLKAPVRIPRQGLYHLNVQARQDRAGDEAAKMEVRFAGKVIKTIEVESPRRLTQYVVSIQADDSGDQELSIAFLNDFYDAKLKRNKDRNLILGEVTLEGPFDLTEEERRGLRLIRQTPGDKLTVAEAATQNLQAFLPRAFRRPVTHEEVARYVQLVEKAHKNDLSFEESMGVALQAILTSPDFLFRVEGGRRQEGQIEMLDDFALASRLSYFLWSSCPDEELFELAQSQRLHEPEILKAQTFRMLNDPRSAALVKNFAGQWLGLRKLVTSDVDPDTKLFPEFTREIRDDLWRETELFFGSIVQENRSIFELLTGRYTFLNEQLARYYGVDGIQGPEFRRVEWGDQHRSGVVTQGSILTLTSYPNRTSPVKRGEWVLSVLLGDAPPPPPPTVPNLEQTTAKNPNLSFRETLELHRTDPGCASCHKVMDAIGFGLENFDAIGRWRTEDQGRPVDSAGMLPDGTKINSADDLVNVLIGRRDEFARHLTEKMMTFAIGRGVDWYDRCAIDGILQQIEQDDRFSSLILGVVNSAPFQLRKLQDPAPARP